MLPGIRFVLLCALFRAPPKLYLLEAMYMTVSTWPGCTTCFEQLILSVNCCARRTVHVVMCCMLFGCGKGAQNTMVPTCFQTTCSPQNRHVSNCKLSRLHWASIDSLVSLVLFRSRPCADESPVRGSPRWLHSPPSCDTIRIRIHIVSVFLAVT